MSIGQSISRSIKGFIFLSLLVAAGYFVVSNYSWVFATTLEGQILAVEKVGQVQVAIIDNKNVGSLFSYAVKLLIKREDGSEEIITGSSEDRQWSVAQIGECVKARFQPYPPWNLEKAGTFFNVRLMSFVRPCSGNFAKLPEAVTTTQPADSAQSPTVNQPLPSEPEAKKEVNPEPAKAN